MEKTQTPKNIALVGGAGFIGHNLALTLKARGHNVHVVDSLGINNLLSFNSTDKEMVNRELYRNIIDQRLSVLKENRIPLLVQDAREYHSLSQVLDSIDPQVVVLLAAVAHADRSNKDPFSTFDHSMRTLENALDFSKKRIERFVYFSSSMVYGNFPEGFVTEETPCNPLGIYGALKYGGEKIVIAYNQVFGLPFTIVRPSALYGERCVSRRVGQIFIENAMRGLDLTIKGDGTDALDFTYIGDLVQGVVKALELKEGENQTFNITFGQSRSVNDMLGVLSDYFPKLKIHKEPKDALMPDRGTLSVEKAKRLLGYDPKFPLEIGFVNYIKWYQSVWKDIASQ